ncbi:hypothetical protein [Streptomyces sp. V4I2]|uniref:hypothetical protein n=1 Tax=Streptomyces sp. V4I2 TaxID=3042280 RepID=UPI00278560E1|nr:hypothetical protein [Streptomyces sp. V4I2]MDQ1050963.1 hypothetical protein [Streptomyces sp. V4I2]
MKHALAAGSTRTDRAEAEPGGASGTAVTVWTDRSGSLVPEPATAQEARMWEAGRSAVEDEDARPTGPIGWCGGPFGSCAARGIGVG